MSRTEGFAPAKLNLTLHVTGQRADGYHLLDSLVVFADVGDRLWFEPAEHISLTVKGPFAPGVPTDARNLVWRAAQAAGVSAHIHLEKNLPHGAGIGGGSSDAAAVLRHFGAAEPAAGLGADVPVCLSRAPQIMRGIGDVLEPVAGCPSWDIVLVNPRVELSTPAVFTALADKTNPPMTSLVRAMDRAGWLNWLRAQRNDLEPPACDIAPRINHALDALEDAELARMSGSGATCFGIYPAAADARDAADRISRDHPSWWVKAARTYGAS